ncbi:MAG: divalent-cation tolerance protein CutA [Deltaproteobacteria bacterium]|jgi:periplasmic divalent cation tolerance protein|nr:divalent-cation tolerance protein CutA [Candidatus Zymogenaceae bacterium]
MTGSSVIMVSASSQNEAEKIANELVENRLAACVSIIPNMRSIYIWEGKVESSEEYLMIIKTRGELFEQVKKAIKELHSYKIPEIISLPITHALDDYIQWINEVTLV